jgi:single-strand DNA-binding protein
MNIAILAGTLTVEPTVTELASGTVVHNYEVAAADARGVNHTVPVAWIDPARPPALGADDPVVVVGVVRRRWFRSGGATQSRTEVLASSVARPRTATARKAIAAAIEPVERSG